MQGDLAEHLQPTQPAECEDLSKKMSLPFMFLFKIIIVIIIIITHFHQNVARNTRLFNIKTLDTMVKHIQKRFL